MLNTHLIKIKNINVYVIILLESNYGVNNSVAKVSAISILIIEAKQTSAISILIIEAKQTSAISILIIEAKQTFNFKATATRSKFVLWWRFCYYYIRLKRHCLVIRHIKFYSNYNT